MTARPLAEFTLAPAPPASASSRTSEWKSGAYAAPTEKRRAGGETEPEDDPLAEAVSSDAPREHASRGRRPTPHPSSTPIWPSDRSYSSRSVGTSTGAARSRARRSSSARSSRPRGQPSGSAPASVRGGGVAYEVLRRSEPERVDRARAGRDDHALRLEVEVERLERELASEAGLLVAAERDARERGVRHVDADRARLDLRARRGGRAPGRRSRPSP